MDIVKNVYGTTAEWAANDIVLNKGELGIEKTTKGEHKIKVGDGTNAWSALPYSGSTPTEVAEKADKVSDATAGHLAVLDANGNLKDGEESVASLKKYVDDSVASGNITVDSALSDTSENPVQNKVVKAAVDAKIDKTAATTDTFAANTLPLRGTNGNFCVGTPTSDNEVANKKYVDDTVASGDVTVDNSLSDSSENPVQNKVIKAAIDAKIDKTSIDSALSGTSENPVQNKVIKEAIDGKLDKTLIDTALSDTSENPVQNKVVKSALDNKLTRQMGGVDYYAAVYTEDPVGHQTMVAMASDVKNNAIVARDPNGRFEAAAPASDSDVANKKYVDDAVAASGGSVTVDSALSDTSENPVQNKVVKAAIDKKLAMKTDGASMVRFYAIATNGQQDTYRATDTATYNTVPLRNEKNNFHVGTPTVDTECATKKYVDDAVAGASLGGGVNTFYTTTKNVPKSFVTANNGVVVVYGSADYSAGSNPWTAIIPLDAFVESSAYNYTFRVLAPTSLADTGGEGSSQGATPFIQITMSAGTDSYTLSASAENFSGVSVVMRSLYGIGTAKSGS